MIDKEYILQLIKESVKSTAPDATLILYGSYARGDYNDESDIDLLILINDDNFTFYDRDRITDPLYDIELANRIFISPKVFTKRNWDTYQRVTPFYYNVTREGIVL